MKTVLLKDICKPKQWKTILVSKLKDKGYPVYGANGIIGYWHEYNHEKPTILVTCRGATCGEINVSSPKSYITGNAMCLDGLDKNYSLDFIEAFLRAYDFGKVISGTAQPQITKSGIGQIPIPILSLSEQKILTERFRRILKLISLGKNALKIYDDLVKSRFVEMFGDPELDAFGNLQSLSECCSVNPKKPSGMKDSFLCSFIPMTAVGEHGELNSSEIKTYQQVKKGFSGFIENDVLFAKITPCMQNGKGAIARGLKNGVGFGSTEFHVLRPNPTQCDSIWLYTLLSFPSFRINAEKNMSGSAGQRRVPASYLRNYKVKIPPLSLQQEFADFVHQVDKLKFDLGICLFILREETFRLSG